MYFKYNKQLIIIALIFLGFSFSANGRASSYSYSCSPNRNVVAKPGLSPSRGNAPLTVTLTGSSSVIGSGCNNVFNASYIWKSSDGQYATGANTQLTYDKPGIYQIELQVKNNYGYSDTAIVSVTVLDNVKQEQAALQREFDKGVLAGQEKGRKECIQNPGSCGINIGHSEQELQQHYDNGYTAGLNDGKQSCIQNPDSCGISGVETASSNCSSGAFSICSEQQATEVILTLKTDAPLDLDNEHHSILIENNATGLQNFGVSVAYLIQDGLLYQYTGDGSSWSWEYITTLEEPIMTNGSISYTISLDELNIYSGHSYKILGLIEDNNWEAIDQTAILQQIAD